jgi:hypothetical protein
MRTRLHWVAVALWATVPAAAGAFDLNLPDPAVSLTVPGIPAIALQEQAGSSGKRVLAGQDDTFSVDVELTRQSGDMSPRVCAGTILRAVVAQPGMPSRDNVYRAPLSDTTFLVIYVIGEGQRLRLHAHLISSAGASHCINAHFVRVAKSGQDVDDWRTTFSSARISSPR